MSVNLLQCYLLFLRPVLFQKCNVALLWLVGTELQNGICCSRSGLPQDWELCLRWIRLHHSVTELWLCFIPDDPDCRVSLTSRSGGGKDCSALLGAFFVALVKKKLWGFGFFFFFGLFILEWRNECKSSLVPPQEEELYACQRGCRLFSICQFVDDGIDLNRTKLECDSGKNSELL